MGERMKERKLFSRRELPVFLVIVILAGLLVWRQSSAPQGRTAVLELDGKTVAVRGLSHLKGPEELTVTGESGVSLTVEFSREGARFLYADCPDKTCQRTGMLTQAGETAICLPGRAVLRLDGAGDTDAQTY